MFDSARDLLKYTVKAEDMSADVEDIFLDTQDLKLRHVVVDIGPWFSSKTAVVSADRFKAPDTDHREWPADLTKAEAEAAPGVEALPENGHEDPSLPFYSSWPPVIVGPAGGTISPYLMQAQVAERLKDRDEGDEETRVGDLGRLRSVSSLLGLPVFGDEGELAKLVDLLIDPEDKTVHHLVIDTGTLLPQQQVVVPAGVISHFPRHGEHLVVNLTKQQLKDSPQLEAVDEIDRNWIDRTIAYYGLKL